MWRRAGVFSILLVSLQAVAISFGFKREPAWGGRVPVTPGHLARAAQSAGFSVKEVCVDAPSAVRSRYPFQTAAYSDPRLSHLRERHRLADIVRDAPNEWTAQLQLKEWVYRAIPGGNPRVAADQAARILEEAARGEKFYCTHYTITYVECALALGWQARRVGVDRRHGPRGMDSTHHGVAEVWSNQFGKWVVVDSQSNLHFEKEGLPLSAWEIRSEWLRDGGRQVAHVVGVPPQAVRKNPAIVWWDRKDEDETATYFWVYVEDDVFTRADRSNLHYLFPQDRHNQGLVWYQNDDELQAGVLHYGYRKNRFLPTWSLEDVYWTVGITEVFLEEVSPGALQVKLESYCPNRTAFEARRGDGTWEALPEEALWWKLKPGVNRLQLRTASQGGHTGPQASLYLNLEQQTGP
ncbi:MAG: transglutaminase domain-containing protein [Acidobacteriota bacterium]